MNKGKYLLKNIGLLTIGQFATKIITFLFTPLYTSILLTSEFGTYDIYNTTITLLIPLLTLNIFEATLRFSLDGKNTNEALKIGIKHICIGSLICLGLIVANLSIGIYPVLNEYWYYFITLFVFVSFVELLSSFARGIDKVSVLALSGVIGSSGTIFANVVLLVVFKFGLTGYFLSHVIGYFFQLLYLVFKIYPIKRIQGISIDKSYEREMVRYSRPLIWNSLAWWINDISDRYIVTTMCGLAANGIYAAAYKIPSMLNIFQTIFNRAWTLSAVKDYDKDDHSGFFTRTYEIYNAAIVILCSFLIIFDKPIALYLFRKDYFIAWQYAPFLLISIVFGSISGYIGGLFAAVKNTKIYSISTGVGAIFNIVFNIILIHFLGVIGAAISTCFSNVLIWLIRLATVKKYMKLRIKLSKHVMMYVILVLQAIILLLVKDALLMYSMLLGCFSLIIAINLNTIKLIIQRLLSLLHRA